MLMALESGELAAQVIANRIGAIGSNGQLREMAVDYAAAYARKFNSRLRLCSLMRRAAFVPGMAAVAIRLFGLSEQLRRRVAEATRNSTGEGESPLRTS